MYNVGISTLEKSNELWVIQTTDDLFDGFYYDRFESIYLHGKLTCDLSHLNM
jgi:hypothetical protein